MTTTATMERFSSTVGGRLLYPADWYIVEKPLPDYAYPEQVFGASHFPSDSPPPRRDGWEPGAREESYPHVTGLHPVA